MLQPLDPQRLDALAREGDVDEGMDFTLHHHMSTVRRQVKEGEDWGLGVWNLLQEGGRFLVMIRRIKYMTSEERKGSDDWYIEFLESPFQDLIVRPSPGGGVDVCVSGKCIKTFQILGCRMNWPALVRWIWEYGDKIAVMSQKKLRRRNGRIEKSLLHQVLHPARFKAQKKTLAKDTAALSNNTGAATNHISATTESSNTASDTARSSRPDGQQTSTAITKDMDISTWKVDS